MGALVVFKAADIDLPQSDSVSVRVETECKAIVFLKGTGNGFTALGRLQTYDYHTLALRER